MILTCPNCGTQYVVKDGAIPPQGRQVRCASCKHSWHQNPEEAAFGDDQETLAEATMIEPRSGPEAEERAYEGALASEAPDELVSDEEPAEVADAEEPQTDEQVPLQVQDYDTPPEAEAQPDDDFSPFADRDMAKPRRRTPLVTVLIVIVLVAAIAAAFWFFAPPQWKARLGLAEVTSTPLELSNPPHIERIQLASGNELLTVAGRVINPTDETHPVPPIYAQLRNGTGKVIYSWTIAPPAPSLGPGASAAFNSAEVNVPAGASDLTISLGQPKA